MSKGVMTQDEPNIHHTRSTYERPLAYDPSCFPSFFFIEIGNLLITTSKNSGHELLEKGVSQLYTREF